MNVAQGDDVAMVMNHDALVTNHDLLRHKVPLMGVWIGVGNWVGVHRHISQGVEITDLHHRG